MKFCKRIVALVVVCLVMFLSMLPTTIYASAMACTAATPSGIPIYELGEHIDKIVER